MAPVTPVRSVNMIEPCLALTVYLAADTVVAPAFTTTLETFCLPSRYSLPSSAVAMTASSVTVWEHLFPTEQHRIMRLLIERVQLHDNGLDIIWRDDSWQRFCREMERHPLVAEQRDPAAVEGIDEVEVVR